MACTKDTVKSSGLNIWSDEAAAGTTPVVDIVAVQGLGSHEFYTWVKKVPSASASPKRFRDKAQFWKVKKPLDTGTEDGIIEVMWIRDLLVPKFQDARIATYSYKSDWKDRAIKNSLRECAEQFLNILSQHRQQAEERRRLLLLIGHSLGGLVIQLALVIAIHQHTFTNLRLSVAGVIFLGAPFQGSEVATFGTRLAQISGLDSTILKLLEKDSPSLYALSRDFWGSYSDWDLVCFYKKIEAEYGPIKKQIVSSQSASLLGKRMIFLDADHSGLNKFSGEDDENFRLVLSEIQRMVEGGNLIVTERYRRNDSSSTRAGNVHLKVPRTVNSLFTGRAELLVRIQAVLRSDNTSSNKQKRFVITGLGGQGKSEICLQVANLLKDDFWGIFWVDVDKPSTAKRDFIAIAKLLGHSIETIPEALQVLATTHRSWLLILDNADDPRFDYQVYLPPGNQGAILMTSRVTECSQYSPGASEALGGLEQHDSKELLLRAAELSLDLWPSYDDQAQEVVRLLGSHTLALIQAGAYISQGHCQIHQYPEVYKRQRQRLLKYRPKQAQSRYRDVYATFEASADVLELSQSESADDALRLLEILSMLDSSVLHLQIFEEGWKGCKEISHTSEEARDIDEFSRDHVSHLPSFMIPEEDEWDPFRLTEAGSLLASLSLVTRQDLDGGIGLSMHPLSHAWAKDRQDLKRQGVAWIATGCVFGFSRSNIRMWQEQERRLLPHILSYLDIKVDRAFRFASKTVITLIILKCGWALMNMRQDRKLSQLLQDMFLELGQNPIEPLEKLLPLYILQAVSLIDLEKNEAATMLLEQILKITEEVLSKTHPDTLTTRSNLALVLTTRSNLAAVLTSQGKYVDAEAMNRQTLKIQEEVLGKMHPRTLTTMSNLAAVLTSQGKYVDAEVINRQTLKIKEEVLGKTHPDTLTTMSNLALVLTEQGKYADAEAMTRQTLEIQEEMLGKMHPLTLTTLNNLARVLTSQGKYVDAEAINRQTLEIKEEVLGKTHPRTLTSVYNLAYLLQNKHEYEEASMLYQRACSGFKSSLGSEHPTTMACVENHSAMLSSLKAPTHM